MTQDEKTERETNRSIARKMKYAANNLDRMSDRLIRDLEEYIGCLHELYTDEEIGPGMATLEWAKDVVNLNKLLFYCTLQDAQLILIRNCEPSGSWKTIIRDGEEEHICEHGIGHWGYPHSCDGCCRHANYPGKNQKMKYSMDDDDE